MNTIKIEKAERSKVKLKIGVSSASGAGKTYSSLLMASGITSWDKICVIDTENNSASLYSHLGDYSVINLTEPHSPERYIEAIEAVEQANFEVIIIDSTSHMWEFLLEEHSKMSGNSFTNWRYITPRYDKFVKKILSSNCHIITTTRRKSDYAMNQDGKGKMAVTKLGMKEIQRDTWEFELSINFALDQSHYATTDKDRTGLFMDKPAFRITKETGKVLIEWANSGKEAEKIEYEPEIKDPAPKIFIDRLKAKQPDLKKVCEICELNVKKWEHITKEQASECFIKLSKLK